MPHGFAGSVGKLKAAAQTRENKMLAKRRRRGPVMLSALDKRHGALFIDQLVAVLDNFHAKFPTVPLRLSVQPLEGVEPRRSIRRPRSEP
jgi:hypothetical protein